MKEPLKNTPETKTYPLVSVIMPTYNGAKTIKRAIESALNQTYPNIEVVVVNDASKDNTAEVLNEIKDKRLKIFSHKINMERSASRNDAMRFSKGEYLAFLDDDDEWLSTKVSKQVKYIQAKDPNIWKAVLSSHEIEGRKVIQKKEGDITKQIFMMQTSLGAGSCLMIRRDVLDTVGFFNENYSRHEDLEFVLRYLKQFKLATMPDILTIVHGHSGVPTGDSMLKVKEDFLKDFEKDIKSLGESDVKKIYARQWLQVSKHYALDGNVKKTFQYLFKSLSFALLFSNRIRFLILENYIAILYHLFKSVIFKKGHKER